MFQIDEKTLQDVRNLIGGGIYPNVQWIQVTTLMNKLGELEKSSHSDKDYDEVFQWWRESDKKVEELEATIASMTVAGARKEEKND